MPLNKETKLTTFLCENFHLVEKVFYDLRELHLRDALIKTCHIHGLDSQS